MDTDLGLPKVVLFLLDQFLGQCNLDFAFCFSWVWSLVGQQKTILCPERLRHFLRYTRACCGCFPEYQIESIRLNWQRRESTRALSLFLLLLRLVSYTCHHTNMSPEIMSEYFPQWQIGCSIICRWVTNHFSKILPSRECSRALSLYLLLLRLVSYTCHLFPKWQIGYRLIGR